MWRCICECGNYALVNTQHLLRDTKMCLDCSKKIKIPNLIGKRFGRLVVLSFVDIKNRPGSHWLCQCDCGKTKIIKGGRLTDKRKPSRSCGCLQAEHARKINSLPYGIASLRLLIRNYKGGAKSRGIEYSLLDTEFIELTKKDCYYCGKEPAQYLTINNKKETITYNGIDRVDNNKGYTLDNCVPCCKQCNQAKSNLSQEEFYAWRIRICDVLSKAGAVPEFIAEDKEEEDG